MIFHPFEFSFSGYSNSGKTTLITRVIKELSDDYKIGYVKHDAHKYQMDKEGKDTWRAKEAGAYLVSINDQQTRSIISQYDSKNIFNSSAFVGLDFILAEGFKTKKMPKAVILNGNNNIFSEIEDHSSVKCLIYKDETDLLNVPSNFTNLQTFQRDQISEITNFILNYFHTQYDLSNIKALVLAGGKSTRMGQDKSSLVYHGGPQTDYLCDLLEEQCNEVYISCRESQINHSHISKHKKIVDRISGFGPLGGILSAQLHDPKAYWLVVACDLPFVNEELIRQLIKSLTHFKTAVCFKNEHRREPLCAIYAPFSHPQLFQMLGLGYSCPQKYLWNSNVEVLEPLSSKGLQNANTYEDFLKIKTELINEIQY